MTTYVLTTKHQELETEPITKGLDKGFKDGTWKTQILESDLNVSSTRYFVSWVPTSFEKLTINPTVNQENLDEPLTEVSILKKEDGVERPFEISGSNSFQNLPSYGYSESYLIYNTKSLINDVSLELEEWERLGTEEALLPISKIKDALKENAKYLMLKDETRILLSLLKLLFQNNKWEFINPSQVRQLRAELSRFRDGLVSYESLKTFSQQLYRLDIHTLSSSADDSKK